MVRIFIGELLKLIDLTKHGRAVNKENAAAINK